MLLTLLLSLPACSLFQSKVDPFTCQVTPAYKTDGTVDHEGYTVNKACLRGIQKRLDACYKE
jgi:hypothetical protein